MAAGQASLTRPGALATFRSGRRFRTLPRFLLALVLALLWATPVAWMILTSLKPESQVITLPPRWLPDRLSDFTLANYANVLLVPRGVDLVRSFLNSLFVAVVGTCLVVVVDTLAAYALSRMHFPGRDVLFGLVVASLIVPPEILLIPNYVTVWRLDWLNSLTALIIPPLAGGFGVFLLRQFFLGIPSELEDAAKIDGCGRLRILWSIVIPVSGGAIATLAIFTFLFFWNEFTWPYIVINNAEAMTLPIALIQFKGDYFSEYGQLMAGAAVSAVPTIVIFLLAQRMIIRSITMTGLKG
ncbi:MAG: carbohydrate ABC transporter permease [Chloroflexota bacterium]|nr:carbohydrate ABC transporter permease [Chloroflexota bacterium]